MTERHTQAEDDILVQRRNHTNTSKVCGAPATAPQLLQQQHKEGGTGEIRERERENERDALARWRSVGKQYAKEKRTHSSVRNVHGYKKKKNSLFFTSFLPTYLPTYLPSFLFTYLSTNLFTSLLLFQPHLVAAHYLPTYLPTYDDHNQLFSFSFFFYVFICFSIIHHYLCQFQILI
jgi:hypothetical protein